MKKNKTAKLNREFSLRTMAVTAFLIVLVFSLATLSYAWYRNYIDIKGTSVTTGALSFSVESYNVDMEGNVSGPQTFDAEEDSENPVVLQSDVTRITSWNNVPHHVYYFIKNPDLETSIDMDVSLQLSLDNVKIPEIIGGINVEITQVALGKIAEDFPETLTDDTVKSIIAEKAPTVEIGNELISFSNLEEAYREFSVKKGEYACIRISYVVPQNLSTYANLDLAIRISLCLAQKNGLPGANTTTEYVVYTNEGFMTALSKYRPNDKITVKSDVNYVGELVINRPLRLAVQNSTFTVSGNLMYAYPYQGRFSIDTSLGGRIAILEKVVEQTDENGNVTYTTVGGNLELEIPSAQIEIVGKNSQAVGNGDIYVQNDFNVTASKTTAGSMTGNGMIVNMSRIIKTNGVLGDSNDLAPINVGSYTKIIVLSHTTLGKIIAKEGSKVIEIENRGTIEEIDLSGMYHDLTYEDTMTNSAHSPQILIENYGALTQTEISLPYLWARKYYEVSTDEFVGNTRIVSYPGAGFIKTNTCIGFKSDGSRDPANDDIEYIKLETFVEKANGSITDIIVQYTSDTGMYKENTDVKIGSTLQSLIEYYSGTIKASTTPMSAGAEVDEGLKIAGCSAITSMKIVCINTSLTVEDYKYIKDNMKQLRSLDLAEAYSVDFTLPDAALQNMSQLVEFTPSEYDRTWARNALSGTGIEEIHLPESLQDIGSDMLNHLKCIHTNTTYIYNVRQATTKSAILLVPDVATYNLYVTAATYYGKVFLEADRYATSTAEYYLRISEENGTCEVATVRGKTDVNQIDVATEELGELKFNFGSVTINGRIYQVTSYDDYSFYNKTLTNVTTMDFGNAIQSIGVSAFGNATGLSGMTFGGDVSIATGAFSSRTINGDVTFKGDATIATSSFNSATINGDLTFNAVTSIEKSACYPITVNGNLTFGTETTFGTEAFRNSIIDGDVTFNGSSHLEDQSLRAITITGGVTYGGDTVITGGTGTFRDATVSEEIRFVGEAEIGKQAFLNLKECASIVFESSANIGENAFQGSAIVTIHGEKIEKLSNQAFANMGSLTWAYLPSLKECTAPFNNSKILVRIDTGVLKAGSTLITQSESGENEYGRYVYVHCDDDDIVPEYTITHKAYNGRIIIFEDHRFNGLFGNTDATVSLPEGYDFDDLKTYYNEADPISVRNVLLPNFSYIEKEDGTIHVLLCFDNILTSSNEVFTIPKEDGSGNYVISSIGDFAYTRSDIVLAGDLVFPETVSVIGDYAFRVGNKSGTFSKKSYVRLLLSNVTEVGQYAFEYNSCAEIIGNSVDTVYEYAFANNATLVAFRLPVWRTLGSRTGSNGFYFKSCNNLRLILIGPTDKGSGHNAFDGIPEFDLVIVDGTLAPAKMGTNFFGFNTNSNNIPCMIYYKGNVTESYSVVTAKPFEDMKLVDFVTKTLEINGANYNYVVPSASYYMNNDNTSVTFGRYLSPSSSGVGTFYVPDRIVESGETYSILGLDVPEYIEMMSGESGHLVTAIDAKAFHQVTFTQSVLNTGKYVTTIEINTFNATSTYMFDETVHFVLESVTWIKNNAFNASKMLSLTANYVEKIEYGAFINCPNLTEINLPAIQRLEINGGTGTFAGCASLKKVILGENLEYMGNYAFTRCSSLESVIILSAKTTNVTYSTMTFYHSGHQGTPVDKLQILFPASVYTKYINHFDGLLASNVGSFELSSIDTTNNITYFFNDLGNNKAELSLMETSEAFLGTYTFPSSLTVGGTTYTVTKISDGFLASLASRGGITKYVLPNELEEFASDYSIISVSLAELEIDSSNEYFQTKDGVLYNYDGSTLIYYPRGKSDESFVVSDSVELIAEGAFYGNLNIKSVTISGDVIISSSVFEKCRALNRVTFSGNVLFAGRNAFKDCSDDLVIYVPADKVDAIKQSLIFDKQLVECIQIIA